MDRDLTINALNKLLIYNQTLTDDELVALKDYINSGMFLVDMDDESKNIIANSTVTTIDSDFNNIIINTAKRTFKIRYGL